MRLKASKSNSPPNAVAVNISTSLISVAPHLNTAYVLRATAHAAIMVIAYLIYVICLRFYPMEELIPKYACPCCGARSFIFNEKSIYQEVCPVCLWKNDPFQKDNPTFPEGINNISLEEAKRNYQTIGVCKAEYVNKN